MRFVDEILIQAIAGDGGRGAVSWRREKFIPNGGPDGGDGGCGGAVVLVADNSCNTLIDFAYTPILKAKNGEAGGSNGCTGASGEDCVKFAPVGTQVYFGDQLIADLSVAGARWIAARGGKGGKGNAYFKSATNQAPDYAQPGCFGEKFEFRLVLKSVADVGLVGLPNVGKSSLVAAITEAHPLVADYPFTTLQPSLGVVQLSNSRRFVIADIPGLIPGAHEGKGLGIKFLQHIERTSVLAQLIDITQDSEIRSAQLSDLELTDQQLLSAVQAQFLSIDRELSAFSEDLAAKPRLVVFSKCDIEIQARAAKVSASYFSTRKLKLAAISSQTTAGLSDLKETLFEMRASKP